MIIQTPRLYLSEFNIKDADGFFYMNQHPEVIRHTGDMPFVKNFDFNGKKGIIYEKKTPIV